MLSASTLCQVRRAQQCTLLMRKEKNKWPVDTEEKTKTPVDIPSQHSQGERKGKIRFFVLFSFFFRFLVLTPGTSTRNWNTVWNFFEISVVK